MKETVSLPKEISLYKKIYTENIDPIKKEVFSFFEIAYIMNNSEAFPVKADDYYILKYDVQERDQLLAVLAMSYIAYRSYQEYKTNKVLLSEGDLLYIMRFINKFYQFDVPIKDKKNEGILWIYPKLEIKRFLSDCISTNKLSEYYFDEVTLTKLILIISSFVRYEYDNADEDIVSEIEALNFPTLVLANIKLYEKGYLRLMDESEGVGVTLNHKGNNSHEKIFTKDTDILKKRIISVLEYSEGRRFEMEDFMD
ncbi:MAG: hypothetical protein FH761_09865 [Firmicutes bacterium]|nr:hypothetical protein [Bacillota bacterium]